MSLEIKSSSLLYEGPERLPLDQLLRRQWPQASWGTLRGLVTSGKVSVEGRVTTDTRKLIAPGTHVEVSMTRPRAKTGYHASDDRVLYCDPHVVVVNKPAGIASVDHAAEPTSMQSEIREWLHQKERRNVPPLRVVQRLDKVTSGVMVFARTQAAMTDLKDQFRAHATGRTYLAVAHGQVRSQKLEFRLVKDRGDGYRGVTANPHLGYHSVTHVTTKTAYRDCTLIECKLETGRTHQIRIHLAALGHPLVGDPLYTRDYRRELIPCERTLLHAASLTFAHPVFRRAIHHEVPLPPVFQAFLDERKPLHPSGPTEPHARRLTRARRGS